MIQAINEILLVASGVGGTLLLQKVVWPMILYVWESKQDKIERLRNKADKFLDEADDLVDQLKDKI